MSRQASAQAETNSPEGSANGAQSASISLVGDEQVLVDARPAWSAYGVHLLIAGLVLLGGLAARGSGAVVGIVLAGAITGYVWFQRQKLRYVITDRRVVKVTGISSRNTNEAWMEDVRGLQTGASMIERFLGHGHITISHSILSTGFGRFQGMTLGGISDYEEIATVIRRRQNQRKATN